LERRKGVYYEEKLHEARKKLNTLKSGYSEALELRENIPRNKQRLQVAET
jgi:hypothetical protein